MAETSAEKHDRLSRQFVTQVAAETETATEMMVVIESVMLATMLVLQRRHKERPGTCSMMVESAVHSATERFAEIEGRTDG